MKSHYCSDSHDDKCCEEPVKVSVRQTEDGRKKKIKIENDCIKIKIRVKDRDCEID